MIALSLTFLLILFNGLNPLKREFMFAIGAVRSPGEKYVAIAFGTVSLMEYAIPSLVFFGALALKRARGPVELDPRIRWTLRVSVVLLLSFWLPSLWLRAAALETAATVQVAILAAGAIAILAALTNLFGWKAASIGVVGTLLLMSLPFYSEIRKKSERESAWSDWCALAKVRLDAPMTPVNRVLFRGIGLLGVYDGVRGDQFESRTVENPGDALGRSGRLLEYETEHPYERDAPLKIVDVSTGSKTPLDRSSASHVVALQHLPEAGAFGFYANKVHVYETATGRTIAESTVVEDWSGKRVCGEVVGSRIDTSEFLARALQLRVLRP